jgi:hypothetical protein
VLGLCERGHEARRHARGLDTVAAEIADMKALVLFPDNGPGLGCKLVVDFRWKVVYLFTVFGAGPAPDASGYVYEQAKAFDCHEVLLLLLCVVPGRLIRFSQAVFQFADHEKIEQEKKQDQGYKSQSNHLTTFFALPWRPNHNKIVDLSQVIFTLEIR